MAHVMVRGLLCLPWPHCCPPCMTLHVSLCSEGEDAGGQGEFLRG